MLHTSLLLNHGLSPSNKRTEPVTVCVVGLETWEFLEKGGTVVSGASAENVELRGVIGDFQEIGDSAEDLVVKALF